MQNRIVKFFSERSSLDFNLEGLYRDLADEIDRLPEGPEKTVALRKLLESRDAACRIDR